MHSHNQLQEWCQSNQATRSQWKKCFRPHLHQIHHPMINQHQTLHHPDPSSLMTWQLSWMKNMMPPTTNHLSNWKAHLHANHPHHWKMKIWSQPITQCWKDNNPDDTTCNSNLTNPTSMLLGTIFISWPRKNQWVSSSWWNRCLWNADYISLEKSGLMQ